MAVESDLLSAQVATASRKQELIQAQNALALARTQLALAIGMPSDTLVRAAGKSGRAAASRRHRSPIWRQQASRSVLT